MTNNKMMCVCGCVIQKRELKRHQSTKKHLKLMAKGYHFIHPNGDIEFMYETN